MLKPHLDEAKKRTRSLVKIENFKMARDLKTLGLGKTYYVKTYGCQMNVHDSENIKAILEMMGFKAALDMEQADLILLNTCAIRENAHNKVFGMSAITALTAQNTTGVTDITGNIVLEDNTRIDLMPGYYFISYSVSTVLDSAGYMQITPSYNGTSHLEYGIYFRTNTVFSSAYGSNSIIIYVPTQTSFTLTYNSNVGNRSGEATISVIKLKRDA